MSVKSKLLTQFRRRLAKFRKKAAAREFVEKYYANQEIKISHIRPRTHPEGNCGNIGCSKCYE